MPSWNLIPECEWLETEQQIIDAGAYLANSPRKIVGFDTETTGVRTCRDYPLMFSLSDGVRRFASMWDPWANHYAIKDWVLQNKELTKIGSNMKFDMHMSANRGIVLAGPIHDTLVMDWLYDENRWDHDLKSVAKDHCGIKMREFKEVFPMLPKKKGRPPDTAGDAIWRKLSTPQGKAEAIEYAGLDAFASVKVHDYLEERLRNDFLREGYSYWDYFLDWEVEFTRVLWNMERRGFMMATGHLKAQIAPLNAEEARLMGELAKRIGHPINPNSPQQLQTLFFQELKYEPIKWTDGGKSGIKKPSTDHDVLEEFARKGCPISALILECRSVVKTRGTYIEGPLEQVDDDLRIHTSLLQHGTVTGRLSSRGPNLQNLPRPANDNCRIREAFVAAPGKVLLVADYEQLEMRIMAHFSQDPRMIKAITDGLDLHCFTVSLMYGVDYDEVIAAKKRAKKVDSDPNEPPLTDREKLLLGYRQAAKATGFGLIYGIGPQKLSVQLTEELGRTVDVKEAVGMIKNYFRVFEGVESFIKNTHARCKQDEFVQTIIGRKRRLPEINARGGDSDEDDINAGGIAAAAKRQSVNSIVQGTAADIAKAAMIRCEYDEELTVLGVQMLLQIHDELIFEVDEDPDVINLARKRIKAIMEHPFPGYDLSVPIPTDDSVAYTWAAAK
jgi:DNA polymerase-1